jgi:hypothetical protein
MLTLKKVTIDEKLWLVAQGVPVASFEDEAVLDGLLQIEKDQQNMAMLLRMMISGSDVKGKANAYLAEQGLNSPLR